MSIKKIVCLVAFVCATVFVQAQQLPHYSMYMQNDFVLNPAIAGKNLYIEGKSTTRYQWIGITDAPRTHIFSVNAPIIKQNMGVGGYVFTDVTGPTRRIGFSGAYAYHMKLNEETKVSLGLSAGFLQFAIDGSKIFLYDNTDQVFSNGYQSTYTADFGFGTYLYSDKYFLGISAPQIYPAKIKFFDYDTDAKLATHFYMIGGYKFDISDNMQIEPNVAVKFVNPAPVQVDIGARLHLQDKAWFGVSYRTMDAISALLGYTYKENLTIGYSYDYTLSNLTNYNSGTHEVFLAVKFHKIAENMSSDSE